MIEILQTEAKNYPLFRLLGLKESVLHIIEAVVYQMLYLNSHSRSFNTLDTFETPVYQGKVLMFCAAFLMFLERRNSSGSESPCLRAIQMA